jgi:hypothetical protein
LAKHSKMFQISDGLDDALDEFVAEQGGGNATVSGVIREAIAAYIGYDLVAEPKQNRARVYVNEAARKEHQKKVNKERNATVKALIEASKRGESDEAIAALAASLARKKVETPVE